jgi:uncharacterized protein YggE
MSEFEKWYNTKADTENKQLAKEAWQAAIEKAAEVADKYHVGTVTGLEICYKRNIAEEMRRLK